MSLSDIVGDFLEDAKDQVSRFEEALMELDKSREDKEALYKLFRAAHSLKGSSYYMGFKNMGSLMHEVENYLEPIVKGPDNLPEGALDLLFKVLDFIRNSLESIRSTEEDLAMPDDLGSRLKSVFLGFEIPEEKRKDEETLFKPIDREDYDPELFSIFLDTLHDQLSGIIEAIVAGDAGASGKDEVIEICENAFKRLISASRYMDYDVLVRFFEDWRSELTNQILSEKVIVSLRQAFQPYLEKLYKIIPAMDYNSLITLLNQGSLPVGEKKSEEEEAEEKIGEHLKVLDDSLEEAFSKWIEEPQGEVSLYEELPLGELSVQEEERAEPSVSLWEDVVQEEVPSVREELLVDEEAGPQPVEMLRVDPGKVDHLLNQVGELVIRRSHFVALTSELKNIADKWSSEGILNTVQKKILQDLWYNYKDALSLLGRLTADLQDAVMKIRMLPLMQLFQRFPRFVREHANQYSKAVRMVIKGGETEVDRRILEQLYEPMVHILRNAVVHGIEPTEVRQSLGKAEDGTITINAYYRGQHVIVEITDDGGGVPFERLKSLLVEQNIYSMEDVRRLSTEELLDTIFLPGVSTAIVRDESAGRGIGLDVVRDQCKKINGHVSVKSWPGQGTQFIIQIPLTLAIIPGLLVKIHGHIYTLPLASILEVYPFDEKRIKKVKDVYFLKMEGRTIPLIFPQHLGTLKTTRDVFEKGHYIVLLRTPTKEAGLVIDQFLGQQEVVIKPIEDSMNVIRNYAGATILGDGTVSLIIDVPAIIEHVEKLYTS